MTSPWLRLLAAFLPLAALSVTACQTSSDDDGSDDGALAADESQASLFRPGNRFQGWGGAHDRYLDEVQPLLGKRCVTCHGCSSSPCQLKLTSYEGVRRGSNPHPFFSTEGPPTRLKDGTSEGEWRTKGFYSVVDGGEGSIMAKLVAHGQTTQSSGFDLAPAYSVYSKGAQNLQFACVDEPGELESRLAKPGDGMPLGLPGLQPDEANVLLKWIADGAPGPSDADQLTLERPRDEAKIAEWESFFNQSDPKWQLVMQYIYEHVFFAKLHFDDSAMGRGDFFELVRAREREGRIHELVTSAPGDDPGAPFFWRLKKFTPLVSAKDHIVIHADAALMNRWKTLFAGSYAVDPAVAHAPHANGRKNPFVAFEAIPATARYQFMLDNAHALIDAMVKGDVCTGSTATSAIRDRFFTLFLKPSSDPSAQDPKLGRPSYDHLDPTTPSPARDAALEKAFDARLRAFKPNGLSEDDIWDGDKKDTNAWITVLRHGTNASAHRGPTGQLADTAWVLDYANFERLYYALVALYTPWGPTGQKVTSWQTMAQVRSHAEDLFLMLLPPEARDATRATFTPGFSELDVTPMRGVGYPTRVQGVDAAHPFESMVTKLHAYLGSTVAKETALEKSPTAPAPTAPAATSSASDVEQALGALAANSNGLAQVLPDVTWLTVEAGSERLPYSLVVNRIYGASKRSIDAQSVHHAELDSVSVIKGRAGAFPQLFLRVPMAEVASFVSAARGSKAERVALRTRYEVKRNTAAFWSTLDEEHARALVAEPLHSGVIDTSAYVWPLELQPIPE
ncbi:MAG: fatty acid cis/trans isomerase [Polyangiaceae bacterium]